MSTLVPLIEKPEEEEKRLLCLLEHPDETDFSEYRRAYKWVGDRGMVGLWIPTPFDWWSALRGGPQAAIMDTVDRPQLMRRVLTVYTDYAVALLDRALRIVTVDSVGLDGSTTSMSVISPALHREYSLPFGRAVCDICRPMNVPVQYHMCGRSRHALPITAEMGVSGFDALESPPTGDVDLGEVKDTFGDEFSLMGNVNSISVMFRGTPEDVVRDVERCMESAKSGGGYMCAVGDQCPAQTPDENIHAFVETARRLGRY